MKNAAQAIEFYKSAFGAMELYRLIDPESGKVGHAEITINGNLIMLADENPALKTRCDSRTASGPSDPTVL